MALTGHRSIWYLLVTIYKALKQYTLELRQKCGMCREFVFALITAPIVTQNLRIKVNGHIFKENLVLHIVGIITGNWGRGRALSRFNDSTSNLISS